jgi:hypothetical protein
MKCKKNVYAFLFLFCSCNHELQIQDGLYVYHNEYGGGYQLHLYSNKVFTLYWQGGLSNGVINGVIHQENGNWILCENPIQEIDVVESLNGSIDSVYIRIVDSKGVPLSYAIIDLGNGHKFQANSDGEFIEKKGFDSKFIEISYMTNRNIIYVVQKPMSNSFEIKVDEDAFYKIDFGRVKLSIKNNHVILKGLPFSPKFKRIRLEKES